MVPSESQTAVEKNSSTSSDAKDKEQLVSSDDQNKSTTAVQATSSLTSPKGAQEEGGFMIMGKGGEQQFGYQPNVYASQPQTILSGGYLNHLGQWEEYPYVVSAAGLDSAYSVMYGAYSPLSTIGDSQSYFSLHYPMSSPYYQPPDSPSTGYSSSATGVLQFDPMHQYYLPDRLHYSQSPGFHQHFGSFDGVPMQSSDIPGYFGQGDIPLISGMESMYNSGSYKASQHGGTSVSGTRTPRCSASSYRLVTSNEGCKHEKGSLDFLNEQIRGPRAWATRIHKEAKSFSAEDKTKKTLVTVDCEKYNLPDFVTEYKDANFFVIKSYTEDHVHKSIKYNVWASTTSGNRKLNAAYLEAKKKEDHCPIFLFFSVNGSGQFCGVAEMIGPVDFDQSVDYWQNDRWSGQFPVKWHIVKDVPNNLVRHIILENNENKRVTNSRDTQEVKLKQGLQMLAIFKNHVAETTILEDFEFYEQREKAMVDNRQQQLQAVVDDRQQQKPQCADAEIQKLVETSPPVDPMTQISAKFSGAVQLEETKGKEKTYAEDNVAAKDCSAASVKTEESMQNKT